VKSLSVISTQQNVTVTANTKEEISHKEVVAFFVYVILYIFCFFYELLNLIVTKDDDKVDGISYIF
jgi:hypothetical protein